MTNPTIQSEPAEGKPATLADLEGDQKPSFRQKPERRIKRKFVLFSGLLFLAMIAFLGAYFLLRGERVDLKANNRMTARVSSGADIRQAAFDSLRDSLPSPSPIPGETPRTDSPAANQNSSTPRTNEKPANNGVKSSMNPGSESVLAPPPEFESRGSSLAPPMKNVDQDQPSKGNAARTSSLATTRASVRFTAVSVSQVSTREPASSAMDPLPERFREEKANFNPPRANSPSFGAMLPVRLMGVLYTIRSGSLARFELMRDLKTEQWRLKRGTIFIGNVSGSGADRAYVQIKGFIDPATENYRKLDGEILGEDGGAGLRGRTRRVASAWGKAFDRAARAGMQLATGFLNRGASSVIIAADPYGAVPSVGDRSTLESNPNRSFVEVPAGAAGFIMVTTLPRAEESNSRSANHLMQIDEVADQDLADLLSSADPDRIRAALPRMTPELRPIAEMTLKEIDAGSK